MKLTENISIKDSCYYSEFQCKLSLIVKSIIKLLEKKDPQIKGHIIRSQCYIRLLAENLSKQKEYSFLKHKYNINHLCFSASLHDIGKIAIPDEILLKPGKLTEKEFEIIKKHPTTGEKALNTIAETFKISPWLNQASEIALNHHEKWNGSGYPNGTKKYDIPLSARLMALADVYDALTSKRVHKRAFSHEKASLIIKQGKDTHFAPDIVDAFIEQKEKFKEIALKSKL